MPWSAQKAYYTLLFISEIYNKSGEKGTKAESHFLNGCRTTGFRYAFLVRGSSQIKWGNPIERELSRSVRIQDYFKKNTRASIIYQSQDVWLHRIMSFYVFNSNLMSKNLNFNAHFTQCWTQYTKNVAVILFWEGAPCPWWIWSSTFCRSFFILEISLLVCSVWDGNAIINHCGIWGTHQHSTFRRWAFHKILQASLI